MAVIAGGDARDLAQAGWGVAVAAGADPQILAALRPLLEHRRAGAAALRPERYQEFIGPRAIEPGESASRWLARQGVAAGPVDPDRGVPYYLLLVGGPDAIPFQFQHHLDVQRAIGRIHFDTLQEYANYAEAVVRAETAPRALDRLAMFGATHPDDPYTQLVEALLTRPLHKALADRFPQWALQQVAGEYATRAGLAELLRSPVPPAVLLCVGHGVAFSPDDPRQAAHQGALLCADWPGPLEWPGPIPPDFYFSADDLADDLDLGGLVALLLASYSAGTPDRSAAQDLLGSAALGAEALLARLPTRMLGGPRGALAVVGLADRAWGYSSDGASVRHGTAALEAMLGRLLSGHPVGLAMEEFNERYGQIAASLSAELEDIKFGKAYDPNELADLWTAAVDSRNITLLGDPAVRLATGATR